MALDSNNLTTWAKIWAGLLLIVFTAVPALLIVAYWPDRQPYPHENVRPLYLNEPFHVRLACITDTLCCTDSLQKAEGVVKGGSPHSPYKIQFLIHLNTLLLILVAAAGFTGNMIHIATSFTTFVGALEFKRSWLLWYFVKPFTAAALSLGLYFVFRAGFLNTSSDSTNINVYGVVTLALLTGLYTDRATLKLQEVVNTIFGIKDGGGRPDSLQAGVFKLASVLPKVLVRGITQIVVLTGEQFDKQQLSISMGGVAVTDAVITSGSIAFSYEVPEPATTPIQLVIKDEAGKELYSGNLDIMS